MMQQRFQRESNQRLTGGRCDVEAEIHHLVPDVVERRLELKHLDNSNGEQPAVTVTTEVHDAIASTR